MQKLTYTEIRERFLNHLKKHGHAIIPSSSVVPENDPTVLYVNSGMFPLVPYLLGEDHPEGTRLADSQRCVRTIDIDEVGDATHLTTFEMLGNWSLNDYFKKEAINITVSFFTEELGIDINKIYGTVFEGDEHAPQDDEAIEIWKEVFAKHGIEAKVGLGERIQTLGRGDNWWELAGGGPCGPCSEMYMLIGETLPEGKFDVSNDPNFVEVGNDVFMQYLKKDGNYTPLGRHNVDFGGGLDRIAMISQGKKSVYETDIYAPIFNKVKELSKNEIIESQRLITDHIKAATWMIMDGVVPGRTEREYILRRIIRRAVRHAKKLGIEGNFTRVIGEMAIDQWKHIWTDLDSKRDEILSVLEEEEAKFNKTLEAGLKEVEKMYIAYQSLYTQNSLPVFKNSNGASFKLFETYGFPPEMLIEELESRNVRVDHNKFWENHNKAFTAHQDQSRTASKGLFKGGLADTSEESTKLHTATHLLLKALYMVLGDHVYQKGSNITPERLRFDFPNDAKLTPEQLAEVEKIVNEQIEKDLPVSWVSMPKDEALALVPYAAFAERYEDTVKVYTIGTADAPFSVEICRGPHVEHTGVLGHFKILKQENLGAGIKRIKAVVEPKA